MSPLEPKKEGVLFDRKAEGQGKSSMFPYNGQGLKAVFIQGRSAPCFGPAQGTAPGNDIIEIPLHFFTNAQRDNMQKLKFQVALKKGFINYFICLVTSISDTM